MPHPVVLELAVTPARPQEVFVSPSRMNVLPGRRVEIFWGFLISSLLLVASPLHAEVAKELAKKHYAKGQTHYNLGRFEKALTSFEAAYEAKPLAGFLFNIGQCHRQLEDHKKAIFFLEGYLREKGDTGNRKTVEELIADSKRKLAAQKQESKPSAEKTASSPPPAPVSPPPKKEAAPSKAQPSTPAAEKAAAPPAPKPAKTTPAKAVSTKPAEKPAPAPPPKEAPASPPSEPSRTAPASSVSSPAAASAAEGPSASAGLSKPGASTPSGSPSPASVAAKNTSNTEVGATVLEENVEVPPTMEGGSILGAWWFWTAVGGGAAAVAAVAGVSIWAIAWSSSRPENLGEVALQ